MDLINDFFGQLSGLIWGAPLVIMLLGIGAIFWIWMVGVVRYGHKIPRDTAGSKISTSFHWSLL